jgi:putative hydrolase of the HAD superfamily
VPFEGVVETLSWLRPRFRLILLTKGDQVTQEGKVDRADLRRFFEAVHVVREKDAGVLRELVRQHELDPGRTWMVGNSPRSDMNPAVEAGIGAIYVPHTLTWEMEQAEITSPERVIELASFAHLVGLFQGDKVTDV